MMNKMKMLFAGGLLARVKSQRRIRAGFRITL